MKKEPGKADPLMWVYWLAIVVAMFLAGTYRSMVGVDPRSGRTLTTITAR